MAFVEPGMTMPCDINNSPLLFPLQLSNTTPLLTQQMNIEDDDGIENNLSLGRMASAAGQVAVNIMLSWISTD